MYQTIYSDNYQNIYVYGYIKILSGITECLRIKQPTTIENTCNSNSDLIYIYIYIYIYIRLEFGIY